MNGQKTKKKIRKQNKKYANKSIVGLCRKRAYYKTKNYIEQHPSAKIYFSYIWLAKTIWLMEEYFKKGGRDENK